MKLANYFLSAALVLITAACGTPTTADPDNPGTGPDNPGEKPDPSEIMIETGMLDIHVWPGQTGRFDILTPGNDFTITVDDPSIATAVIDGKYVTVSGHSYGQTGMTISDGIHKSCRIGIYTFLDGSLRLPDEYEKYLPEITVEAADGSISEKVTEDIIKWQDENKYTEYWFTHETAGFVVKKGKEDITGTYAFNGDTLSLAFNGETMDILFEGRKYGYGPGAASADLTWDVTETFAGKYPQAGISRVTVRQCYQAIAPVPYWNSWNTGDLI